jgi:hypothetical protein
MRKIFFSFLSVQSILYTVTRPYLGFRHRDRMEPDQTVRILVEALRVLAVTICMHVEAVQCTMYTAHVKWL